MNKKGLFGEILGFILGLIIGFVLGRYFWDKIIVLIKGLLKI
jgi:hypothetical protein